MYKLSIISFVVLLGLVYGNPLLDDQEQRQIQLTDDLFDEGVQYEGSPLSLPDLVRQVRVTCDVLSPTIMGNSLNHAPCALHCIALRKKGGSCVNGVCHCYN